MAGAESLLHLRAGRPLVDGVYVNGHGPYRFLLDTGAESNQLNVDVAREIGLRPAFLVEIATVAGVGLVGGTDGVRVSVGTETAATELLFTDMAAVRELSGDINGVLGQAFLSRFDYLLDLRGRRIVFGAGKPEGLHAELDMSTARPTVFTSLGRLVIDSGTDRLILFETHHRGGETILRTANGFTSATVSTRRRLFIEGREIRHAGAVTVPTPVGSTAEDGLLPAATFHSIYFCHSKGYLVFQ
jgi:hypothetical protein